jgi:hypothetical protein
VTKEEVYLLSKIVLACKASLGMQAGMLPTLKDECFRQIEELDKALDAVKNTANAHADCERASRDTVGRDVGTEGT